MATDVLQADALRILEQPEDYPSVLAEQQSVRAYPRPYGVNLAHVLGYLSPITEDEFDQAKADGDRSVNGASSVGRAGVEKEYDTWLRGMPGYRRVAVDSMGRVLGDDSEVQGQPGDTLVTSIDAKVGRRGEAARRDDQARPPDPRHGHRRQLQGRLGCRGRARGEDRPGGRDGKPADVRPVGLGGRHHQEPARPPLLREGRHPAAGPRYPRPVRSRLDLEAVHDRRGTHQRLLKDTQLACSSSFRVGNRDFKNYESGAYGSIGFAKALEVSCNTFFYRVGYDFWQRFGSDVADVDARTRSSRPRSSASAARPASTSRARPRADRGPEK